MPPLKVPFTQVSKLLDGRGLFKLKGPFGVEKVLILPYPPAK
jgi:hypothetical protein